MTPPLLDDPEDRLARLVKALCAVAEPALVEARIDCPRCGRPVRLMLDSLSCSGGCSPREVAGAWDLLGVPRECLAKFLGSEGGRSS